MITPADDCYKVRYKGWDLTFEQCWVSNNDMDIMGFSNVLLRHHWNIWINHKLMKELFMLQDDEVIWWPPNMIFPQKFIIAINYPDVFEGSTLSLHYPSNS